MNRNNRHQVESKSRQGNEAGVAMAEALKCNSSLQSFKLDARRPEMGNEAGMAMAEACMQMCTAMF